MTDFPPLRFGILGAANIARQFSHGVAGSKLVTMDAVASRGAEKAAAFAAELGIPRAHASYEALLADPAIEAIYIPLPNTLHAEWATKAAAAGKHVLCEKPLAMTTADARAMYAAAREHGVHLAEAYPYMSQPQTLRLREILAEGAIGAVQMASVSFGFRLCTPDGVALRDPTNIRLDPAVGGGSLFDAGTYSMSFLRLAMGECPTRAMTAVRWTKSAVDMMIAATLEFPGGAIGQMTSCFSSAGIRNALVIGDNGVVETNFGNHAPPDGVMPLRIRRGVVATAPFDTESLPGGDGFLAEAESFAQMVRLGPTYWNGVTEAESVDTVRALEAIAASARAGGGWVDLAA